MITDIGGLNDKGFNALGLQRPQGRAAPVRRHRVASSSRRRGADYIPNLSTAARQGYDLVIARRLPDGRRDRGRREEVPEDEVRDHRRHARRPQGQAEERARHHVRRAGGGLPRRRRGGDARRSPGTSPRSAASSFPAVDAYIAGYQYCAKKVKPGIKTLNGVLAGLRRSGKCKEVALNQIGAGLGRRLPGRRRLRPRRHRRRRRTRTRWGIGVDNDQSFLGTQVLTSALKKVDAGVTQTIKLVKDGKYKGGVESVFNVKNGGVGYGKVSVKAPARSALIAKLNSSRSRSRPARSSRRARSAASTAGETRTTARAGRTARPLHIGGGRVSRFSGRDHRISPRWLTRANRARDAAHHEALPRHRRQRRRQPRPLRGRGARAARRERRRQVDADEHPLRALPPRRGRDRDHGQAGAPRHAERRDRRRRRDGAPALHADPGDDGGREHRPRHRADARRRHPRPRRGRASASARSRSASGSPSTRARRSRTSPSASSSASRS